MADLISFENGKKVVDSTQDFAYNVLVGRHVGELMSRSDYISCVDDEVFCDDDGWGHQLNDAGEYVDNTSPGRVDDLDKTCSYILWFNK